MELPHIATIAGILAGIIFFYVVFTIAQKSNANRNRPPPEARGGWPVIGHLLLLSATEPTQTTLAKMADKYGPIFTLRLGMKKALVISNWRIAKECFTTNDRIFASRPRVAAGELLGYEYAVIGTSLHGPLRTHMRKIATHELLSNRRLAELGHIRESEVERLMKGLHGVWVRNKDNQSGKVLVEMKALFGDLAMDTIFRMVIGERFSMAFEGSGGKKYYKAMRNYFDLFGVFVPSDLFPFLNWFDLGGHKKKMKKTARVLDEMLNKWLEQHRQKGASIDAGTKEYDLMDVMLSIVKEDDELSSYDSNRITKASCLAMILGGFDTTSIAMQWALALLLNNEESLKKVQLELDEQIGRERKVVESDLKYLVYLEAVIKETLRLYPAVPIALPHESIQNCKISGYHISTRTRLLVNLQKLHRDPLVWKDPNEFQPERFLTNKKHFEIRGQNPELIPFGSGRMMCPGISFALQIVCLAIANLLHMFEVGRPSMELIDMEMGVGTTCVRKKNLEIVLSPRLGDEVLKLF